MQARCWRGNRVARQQVSGPPRILGGDDGNLAQDSQGAHGDVFEVADRRGDHEQRPGHVKRCVYCTIDGSVLVEPARPVKPGHMRRNDDCFRAPVPFRRRSALISARDASHARDAGRRAHA